MLMAVQWHGAIWHIWMFIWFCYIIVACCRVVKLLRLVPIWS